MTPKRREVINLSWFFIIITIISIVIINNNKLLSLLFMTSCKAGTV